MTTIQQRPKLFVLWHVVCAQVFNIFLARALKQQIARDKYFLKYHKYPFCIGCCKRIRVSSRFKREGDRIEDEIFVLQQEYPRIYENSAGDKITRYGGLCYKKEEHGYWMGVIKY